MLGIVVYVFYLPEAADWSHPFLLSVHQISVFISFRSFRPDILSILDHTAAVPLKSAFPHAPFRFRQPPDALCVCIQPFVFSIEISKFAVIRM